MNSITLKAPAKINLYLDVLSKRRDGYHNIATLFQKVNLCDTVKVRLIPKGIRLTCTYPHVPRSRANLAYKAAALMKREFNLCTGVDIHITKRIPSAAGLGGGSSDAACTITAINRLCNLNLPVQRLMNVAERIGADVPFFVSGHNCAIGCGIGEQLKEIRHKSLFYVLLLVPTSLTIHTKSIYRKIRLPLTRPDHDVNILAHTLLHKERDSNIRELVYNRLEDIVLPVYPIAKEAKHILSLYNIEGVLLSGSGPTVYALFNSRREAMRARDRIRRDGRWQLFLTETI